LGEKILKGSILIVILVFIINILIELIIRLKFFIIDYI
jgi:hypothetical protein